MKVLMFNHHPDVLHYAYKAFQALGIQPYVASEQLAYKIGFKYSSTRENKFEVVNRLYDPQELYPDIGEVKFSEEFIGFNLYWSMLPEIKSLEHRYGINTWFDAQMQDFLRNPMYAGLPGIKSANHPDAFSINKFSFLPNWVPHQPPLKEKKYITQLITELYRVKFTNKLKDLKSKGLPVRIHGGDKCPDGFIRDIDILPYTTMLVHNKQFGINCYAVCKALDMGIPVYMERITKEFIGFGDLPDDLFLFAEDLSIEDAYKKSLTIDNSKIQETYRSIYTLDRTIGHMENILEEKING